MDSPKPICILELDAIRTLSNTHHVIAGGGGGIPLCWDEETKTTDPRAAVVDKDWTAALLASELQATHLIFATNVQGVFPDTQDFTGKALRQINPSQAQMFLTDTSWGRGSMAPKLASALTFNDARPNTRPGKTVICHFEHILEAVQQAGGTEVIK